MTTPHRPVVGDARFGQRTHPVTGVPGTFHNGIDLIRGNPSLGDLNIVAIADGVVTNVVYNLPDSHTGNVRTNTAGNLVDYVTDNGILVRNLHLAAGSVTVRRNDRIRMGQVIGVMGRTGSVTGLHLHFEMRRDGKPFDPLPLVNAAHFDNFVETPMQDICLVFPSMERIVPARQVNGRWEVDLPAVTGTDGTVIEPQRNVSIRAIADWLGIDLQQDRTSTPRSLIFVKGE